jgi:hypothetical protein
MGIGLAPPINMSKEKPPMQCYIATFRNGRIDPDLQKRGFSLGMIVFAIPELGILFRCRADGDLVDLEFGAFFALLKFIKSRLPDLKVPRVQVLSSNPEFVFAFTGNTRHLKKGTARYNLVAEYQKRHQIIISYCDPLKNKALVPASEYPALPEDRRIGLKPEPMERSRPELKPFQRGLRL